MWGCWRRWWGGMRCGCWRRGVGMFFSWGGLGGGGGGGVLGLVGWVVGRGVLLPDIEPSPPGRGKMSDSNRLPGRQLLAWLGGLAGGVLGFEVVLMLLGLD